VVADELEQCRKFCYAGVTREVMLALYSQWGGVVRWTLDKALDVGNNECFENAIAKCDLTVAMAVCGVQNAISVDMMVHSLLHLRVSDDYERAVVKFASRKVTQLVLQKLKDKMEATTKRFLIESRDEAAQAGLRGQIFEAYCHRVFPLGGTYPYRDIAGNEVSEMKLPQTDVSNISVIADVSKLRKGQYGLPDKPNFPVADSVALPDAYQMTVSVRHGESKTSKPIVGSRC